jgi:hypothetical protein
MVCCCIRSAVCSVLRLRGSKCRHPFPLDSRVAQMLAMSPPGPEALPALEEEIELLRRALLLCDILPCRGTAAVPADKQGEGRVKDDEVQEQTAGPGQRLDSGRDRQAPDVVVVSDSDEDFKHMPQPRRRRQQQPMQQRQTGSIRSARAVLHVGDAVEVMWEMGGHLEPFHGHVLAVTQVTRLLRVIFTSCCWNRAVVLLSGHTCGPSRVCCCPPRQGRHTIGYLDGETAEHNLDEEQWRPLPKAECQRALQPYKQLSGSSSHSRDSSGSGALHGLPQGSAVDAAAAVAAAALAAAKGTEGPLAGTDPYLFRSFTEAQVPGDSGANKQRMKPRPPQQATRAPLSAMKQVAPPPQASEQPRQARQQGRQKEQRGSDALKENMQRRAHQGMEASEAQEPAWLQSAASLSGKHAGHGPTAQAQQLFSRKRKCSGDGGGQPPSSPAPPLRMQQQEVEPRQVCAAQPAPSTQDAAGALFAMHAGPAAAAAPVAGAAEASGARPAAAHPVVHHSQAVQAPGPRAGPGNRPGGCAVLGTAWPEPRVEAQRQRQDPGSPLKAAADLFKGLSEVEEVSLLSPSGPDAGSAPADEDEPPAPAGALGPPQRRQGRCLVIGVQSSAMQRQVLKLQAALGDAAIEDSVTE